MSKTTIKSENYTPNPVPPIRICYCTKLVNIGERSYEESVGFLTPNLAIARGYISLLDPSIRARHYKAAIYSMVDPRVTANQKGSLSMVGSRCALVEEIRL